MFQLFDPRLLFFMNTYFNFQKMIEVLCDDKIFLLSCFIVYLSDESKEHILELMIAFLWQIKLIFFNYCFFKSIYCCTKLFYKYIKQNYYTIFNKIIMRVYHEPKSKSESNKPKLNFETKYKSKSELYLDSNSEFDNEPKLESYSDSKTETFKGTQLSLVPPKNTLIYSSDDDYNESE